MKGTQKLVPDTTYPLLSEIPVIIIRDLVHYFSSCNKHNPNFCMESIMPNDIITNVHIISQIFFMTMF